MGSEQGLEKGREESEKRETEQGSESERQESISEKQTASGKQCSLATSSDCAQTIAEERASADNQQTAVGRWKKREKTEKREKRSLCRKRGRQGFKEVENE